jgi:hypothetical protein
MLLGLRRAPPCSDAQRIAGPAWQLAGDLLPPNMTGIKIIQLSEQTSWTIIAPVKTSTAAQSMKARMRARKVPAKAR